MKDIQDYQKDIASIRDIMERSVKFISLSGLSGVLAGVYALLGSAYVYFFIFHPRQYGFAIQYNTERAVIIDLLLVAIAVLVLSIGTGFWLSMRKANKLGVKVWNRSSQQLSMDLSIPLLTGGAFILLLLYTKTYDFVIPANLVFYGLALINASRNTFPEIRYLGLTEIVLGLTAVLVPGDGLIFWALGFGVMHIIYGAVMHFRYDK